MPAKYLYRTPEEKTYSHVYNRGIEKRTIFNDEKDYEVFQGFLNNYLTPPADAESIKKSFTVNGHDFRGTPHRPKNYFNKVELMAYSLMPDHFHLLLHQITRGSLEGFIRSLCTRYSMYFNKKYERTGALFEGPYKSVQIKDVSLLYPLTHHIHHGSNDYSSYPEYSGKRKTSWVNTNVVLSLKGADNYKDKELPDGITFENETQYFEGRDREGKIENTEETGTRIPEISALFAVFLVLLGLGVRNINVSASKNLAVSPTLMPAVLSDSVQPTSPPAIKTMVVVEISDGTTFIDIRQNPTIDSLKVGEAKNGDAFEFVSVNSGWYEVKLAGGLTGFIWAKNTYLLEQTNN